MFDFEELEGSPTESFDSSGIIVSRRVKIPWSQRLEFIAAMKGNTVQNGDTTIYTPPQQYEDIPGLYVDTANAEPWHGPEISDKLGDGKWATYQHALVSITYRTGTNNSSGGGTENEDPLSVFTTEDIEPTAEYLTLSNTKLYWDAARTRPLAETEAPTKLIRGLEWVYTVHRLRSLPNAVKDLTGKVNSNTITSRRFGFAFAAETLLYAPPRIRIETMSDGTEAMSAEFRFTYRPSGWNKFFKAGISEPQTVYDDLGVAYEPYETGNFSALIVNPIAP